jgi:hypothetical protein
VTGEPLQFLILYHRAENVYSVSAHNQTPAEAQAFIEQWNKHLKPGYSLIAFDQRKPHTTDTATCRACRDAVRRRSGLQPQPRFQRRKS